MSSSSSESESDDEMKSRLLESVTTLEKIKQNTIKEKNIKINLIKVGPYGDIELSKQQINCLVKILNNYTDKTLDFRI